MEIRTYGIQPGKLQKTKIEFPNYSDEVFTGALWNIMKKMTVESERLLLYPISDDDMRSLIENEKDAEMKQAYGEMLEGCLKYPEQRIWHAVWFMELKNRPGVIVGDFCFKGLRDDGCVEIGYGLRKGFCGYGYMTETVKKISEWALSQDGVSCVEAETEEQNIASANVLKHAGFQQNGKWGEEGPRYVYVNRGTIIG